MTHHIKWLIPNHILSASLSDKVGAEEVGQIAEQMHNQISALQTAGLVHLLIDVRHCVMSDKVWKYSNLKLKRHDSTGWSVVVGDSRLGGLVIAIFSKILSMSINYSPSPEAALAFLAQRDPAVAEHLRTSDADLLSKEI